jgi:hypothetical protein
MHYPLSKYRHQAHVIISQGGGVAHYIDIPITTLFKSYLSTLMFETTVL